MASLAEQLRDELPKNCCNYDDKDGYHKYGMGYFQRKLVAQAADRIEELEALLARFDTPIEQADALRKVADEYDEHMQSEHGVLSHHSL